MSIEKKAEAAIEALTDFINAQADVINALAEKVQAAPAASPKAETKKTADKKTTKKQLKELQGAAKSKAGDVMKELGKAKLQELLARFGCKRFTEILDEADVYKDFIKKADAMLDAGDAGDAAEESDPLADDEPAEDTGPTADDVKELFIKVNNHPDLGRDVTKQLLAELGVARLTELKKDKFKKAVKLVKNTLDEAGKEKPEEDDEDDDLLA